MLENVVGGLFIMPKVGWGNCGQTCYSARYLENGGTYGRALKCYRLYQTLQLTCEKNYRDYLMYFPYFGSKFRRVTESTIGVIPDTDEF